MCYATLRGAGFLLSDVPVFFLGLWEYKLFKKSRGVLAWQERGRT